MSDWIDRVEAMKKRQRTLAATTLPEVDRLVQLPLWSNDKRGMPNALARSGLFNAAKPSATRRLFKDVPIATVDGISLHYTGEELRQDDHDVLLQVVHLARLQPLDKPAVFSVYSMLKELGIVSARSAYQRVEANLERLQGGRIKLMKLGSDRDGNYRDVFVGNLIRKFVRRERDNAAKARCAVWLEPEIVAMFGPADYSLLDFNQRLKLTPTGKWLHGFYLTHREPFGYKMETLHRLCQSDCRQLYHFRPRIKSALQELVEVDFLKRWEVRNDVVLVERNLPLRLSVA